MSGSSPTQAKRSARARTAPGSSNRAAPPESNGWEREVVNSVPDLICVIERGHILSINPSGASMLGYRSTSRLCGRPFGDFVHPDSAGDYQRMLRRPSANAPPYRIRLKRSRRAPLEVEARIVAVNGENAGRLVIHAKDSAERQLAEESFLQAQAELEEHVAERARAVNAETAERRRAETELLLAGKVIHSLTEAVMITDTAFNVTNVNPAHQNVTGRTPKEVIGRQAPFLAPLKADQDKAATMRRVLAESGRWEGEIWDMRKDGECFAEHFSISAITDERVISRIFCNLV